MTAHTLDGTTLGLAGAHGLGGLWDYVDVDGHCGRCARGESGSSVSCWLCTNAPGPGLTSPCPEGFQLDDRTGECFQSAACLDPTPVFGYDGKCYPKDTCKEGMIPFQGVCLPASFCSDGSCGAFVAGGSGPGPAKVALPGGGPVVPVTVQPDGRVTTGAGQVVGRAEGGVLVPTQAAPLTWGQRLDRFASTTEGKLALGGLALALGLGAAALLTMERGA